MNADISSGARALQLGTLGFGGAGIGNLYRAMPDSQAAAIVEAAWDAGIRYFDTAPHYGLGLSERRLGSVLKGKPRQEFVVSTKVRDSMTNGPAKTGGPASRTAGSLPSRAWRGRMKSPPENSSFHPA